MLYVYTRFQKGGHFKYIYISFVSFGEIKVNTKGIYIYIYFWNVNLFVNECIYITYIQLFAKILNPQEIYKYKYIHSFLSAKVFKQEKFTPACNCTIMHNEAEVFCCKIFPTSLGTCKPTFYTFYTSHLRWNGTIRRCFYHSDLGQNAVFHNFAIQIALTQYSGRSKHAWAFSETL